MPRLPVVLSALWYLTSLATADPRESVTFTNVISNGTLNAASNSVRTTAFTGMYATTMVRVTATLTKLNTTTFAREARIQVTPPTGSPFVLQPFTVGAFSGSISTSTYTFTLAVPISPSAGTWTFRFHEAFDDPGNDSRWDTITFTLDDGVPQPPTSEDLGTLAFPVSLTRSYSVTPGQVNWYRLNLPSGAASADLRYLDIDTGGSVIGAGDDTEMALYSATGVKVAEDDDDGPGNTSFLSFGTGSFAGVSQGQDGSLAPGVYYLAVAGFDATFGPGFAAVTNNPSVGLMQVHLSYRPTPLEVTGFTPATAREGDLVTISGRGFGDIPGNLAVMVPQPDGTTVPLTVESASGASMSARVGSVRPGASNGQLQVWRGAGVSGSVTPASPAIVPDPRLTVTGLDARTGPAPANSPLSIALVASPTVEPEWLYGVLDSGAIRVAVGEGWPQNSTLRIVGHVQSESGVRSCLTVPPVRIRLSSDPSVAAQRVCDLLSAAYAQRLPGVFIACETVDGIVRVRTRTSAAGSPQAVSLGSFDVLPGLPQRAITLSGRPVSAFGDASLSTQSEHVHVSGLTGSGSGVTFDAGDLPNGVGFTTAALALPSGAQMAVGGWGSTALHPREPLGTLSVGMIGSGATLSVAPAGFATGMVRVQVYSLGTLVGESTLASGQIATISNAAACAWNGGGFSALGVPYLWLGLSAPASFRVGGVDINGDQLRVLFPSLANAVASVEAVDLSVSHLAGPLVVVDADLVLPPLDCPADFNLDGGIDGSDISDFFDAWEAGDQRADVNQDGGVDGSDTSAFIDAWEAGSC